MTRHYGMDWLRIGAFALLIFYHIGMVFVPWNFHVKSAHVVDWATLPMLATNAWRLTLLFVVSGYASRALLQRSSGIGAFLGNRSYRLLLPLLFGVVVIVPPQAWVELVTKSGYAGSYPTFWLHDWFSFVRLGGVALPTWNHLWFVGYLWVYTMALGIMVLAVRTDALQRWFDKIFAGVGVVLLPFAWLVVVHSWLFPMAAETQALIGDWIAHLTFLPAFLFGFGLARSDPAMAAIARWWRAALALAVIGYAVIVGIERWWPGEAGAPRSIYPFYGAAHALQQWAAVVALIGIAERYFNRDRPIRPMLTEAVFPFYLIHQTIIVVVMWAILPAGLPAWAEFAVLVGTTIAGCWFFYLIGRSIRPLRPLIGLRSGGSGAQPPRTSPAMV